MFGCFLFCFFLPLVRANSCPKFVPVLNAGCDVCGHQSEHCASEGFEHAGVPSKYLRLSLDKYTHALYTLHRLCDALQEGIKRSWHRIRSACTHQEGAKWCIHPWELHGWRIRHWLHGSCTSHNIFLMLRILAPQFLPFVLISFGTTVNSSTPMAYFIPSPPL